MVIFNSKLLNYQRVAEFNRCLAHHGFGWTRVVFASGDLIAGVQLTAYGSHWMTQWHPEHTVGQFSLPSILQCEAPKIAKLVYNSNSYGF